MIHFGFGLEFNQPAIIAEALAEAAVHNSTPLVPFLHAVSHAPLPSPQSQRTLPQLLTEIRNNPTIANAARWEDNNKVYDGVFGRALNPFVSICSQWRVSPSAASLAAKTAEMYNAAIYFTAAAQRPDKIPKIDFYYMHCANVSIFFKTINALPWLPLETKCRMLEIKAWVDLAMYASRHVPQLRLEEITGYRGSKRDLREAFEKVETFGDDGHAVKLVRAVASGAEVCRGYEGEEWCTIKGDMWLKVWLLRRFLVFFRFRTFGDVGLFVYAD